MRSLARYILTGPFQATTVVFGFALLSVQFTLLIILSGGALALITLQLGLKQSVSILVICMLLALSTLLVFGSVAMGPPSLIWPAVVVAALIYRNTQSLNLTLQLLLIFGVIATALAAIAFPNFQFKWLNYLQSLFEIIEKDPSFQIMLQNMSLSTQKIKQYLPVAASVMTGSLVSLYLLVVALTLFLGRWWQDLQGNIQSFRKEFVNLRLGKALAGSAILFILGALVVKHAILWQLAIVCLSMFSLQGIAIAHAIIGQLFSSIIGFVVLYGLLLIAAPQMVVALSTLGMLDTFVDFRSRLVKSKT